MIFKYEVEIEVDEESVTQKYPNYISNYQHPRELAESIAFGFEYSSEFNVAKDGLKDWGYSVEVKKNREPANKILIDALEYVGFALTENVQEAQAVLEATLEALQTGNVENIENLMNK